MSASFLPAILVPLTCLIFPALTIVFIMLYAENQDMPRDIKE
ncbi:MAG: photosystem I reaction center subunit VIII [Calothrix sp. FI2-JRJ7]|nr:photosystem I reaction center subunit VIII [Calothrix sp. FI2-JRJ7]